MGAMPHRIMRVWRAATSCIPAIAICICSLPAQNPAAPPSLAIHEDWRIDGATENLVPIGRSPRNPGVAISASGLVGIRQQQDGRVLIYDAMGRRASGLGRQGQGPGEFGMIGNLGWIGDTLWVEDQRGRTVTYFSARGSLIRSEPYLSRLTPQAVARGAPPMQSFRPVALLGGGVAIGKAWQAPPLEEKNYYARATLAGELRQAVAEIPLATTGRVTVVDGQTAYGIPVPQLSTPLHDLAPDGLSLATVNIRIVAPTRAEVRVTRIRTTGDTVLSKTLTLAATAVARAEVLSNLDRQLSNSRSYPPAVADQLRAKIRTMLPDGDPPVVGLILGSDGTMWLQQPATATTNQWLMLDSQGSVRGTISVPLSVSLLEGNSTHVWGVAFDSNDVESVVRYSVALPR